MLKRLSSALVAGALVTIPVAVSPTASAQLVDNPYNRSPRCIELRVSFTELSSTQRSSTPYVIGKGMLPASDKVGTHLNPSVSFQANPGTPRTASVDIQWDWTDHVKRASSLKDLAIKHDCGSLYTSSQFEVRAIDSFNSGTSAGSFMRFNPISVTLQPKLYKSAEKVPNFIRYQDGSVYVTPTDPNKVQDRVYNLHFKTRMGDSVGPEFVWPVRVIQVPSDSGLPTEVKDFTNDSAQGKSSSSGGGGLFGGLFSFSS